MVVSRIGDGSKITAMNLCLFEYKIAAMMTKKFIMNTGEGSTLCNCVSLCACARLRVCMRV